MFKWTLLFLMMKRSHRRQSHLIRHTLTSLIHSSSHGSYVGLLGGGNKRVFLPPYPQKSDCSVAKNLNHYAHDSTSAPTPHSLAVPQLAQGPPATVPLTVTLTNPLEWETLTTRISEEESTFSSCSMSFMTPNKLTLTMVKFLNYRFTPFWRELSNGPQWHVLFQVTGFDGVPQCLWLVWAK